jgi:hypothetical protein
MKIAAMSLWLVAFQAFALAPVPSDQDAQRAHGQGSCGSMGPGSGLSGNKGWVVSMLPGRHQFRVRGGAGQVYVTVARQAIVDFDVGRPYYIVVEGAGAAPELEWKIPGSDWGPVSKYFLYPVTK